MSQGFLYLEFFLLVILPVVAGIAIDRWASETAKKRGWTPLRIRTLRLIITALWVSIAIYGLSATTGPYSILSTVTASAIAGITVTLALQTALQNFIAGFILLRRRFLAMGDEIQISNIRGTVVALGLVTTVLRQPDGTLTVVSNSNLLSGPLINYTATTRLAGEY